MPKIKQSEITRMNRLAKLANGVLIVQTYEKTNSRVLYCQACYTTVNGHRETHLCQHWKNVHHLNVWPKRA